MPRYSYYRRNAPPERLHRRWIDPRVNTLPRQAVIAYLLRRGWKQLPTDREGFLAFQEPTGEEVNGHPLCQFVPDSEAEDMYQRDMFDLLTGLAEFEQRWASHIIDDILAEKPAPAPTNGPAAPTSAQPATR